MQTQALYYQDPHLAVFSAQVLRCTPGPAGYEVILDRTAFFPAGGGQRADTGTLGPAQVLDVREQGEQIVHICNAPLPVGTQVTGELDYRQRFARMQGHSGEHLVSGVIHRRYGYHNVGFHMGADCITIDFDGVIPGEDLPGLEEQINAAIWENRPVRGFFPTRQELETLPYRSKKELTGDVRLVEIQGYDLCACCAPHVTHTGQIGPIKLLSVVGFRGGTRMEILCGSQAYQLLSQVFRENRQVSQALSVPITQTGQGAQRLLEQVRSLAGQVMASRRRLFELLARIYRGQALALHFEPELPGAALGELAQVLAEQGSLAAVFSGGDGAGYSYCLASMSQDLRPLGKAMNAALQGRGGGKPHFQQGRVQASQAEIEDFFRTWPEL